MSSLRSNPGRQAWRICFFLILLTVDRSVMLGQNPDYPNGVAYFPDKQDFDEIKSHLNDLPDEGVQLLQKVYGPTYDETLPDIVVYITHSGSVKLGLFLGGKYVSDGDLRGHRSIWVLLFSSKKFGPGPRVSGFALQDSQWTGISHHDTQTVDLRHGIRSVSSHHDTTSVKMRRPKEEDNVRPPDTVSIRKEGLEYQQEPGELSVGGLLGFVTSLLSGTALNARPISPGYQDSIATVEMGTLWCDNEDTLYFGSTHFDIATNSVNRIVVKPNTSFNKGPEKQIRHISFNFGNFERSRLAAGVGVGVITGRVDSGVARVKPFLFGCIYLIRPSLPKSSGNLGVVVGTNILKDSFFTDLVLGVKGGGIRTFSSLGLILGIDVINIREGFLWKRVTGFVALDYRL